MIEPVSEERMKKFKRAIRQAPFKNHPGSPQNPAASLRVGVCYEDTIFYAKSPHELLRQRFEESLKEIPTSLSPDAMAKRVRTHSIA